MKLKEQITVGYIRMNLKISSAISKKWAAKKALQLFCTPFGKTKKRISPLFDKSEKLDIYIDKTKLVGYRWNHPQPKKLLVIHGFQSSANKFERYITAMINKGYEVIAFDAKAHGNSEGTQINVLEYRKMIEEINERYGPINAFMAHSFGGLAVSLALENIVHTSETKLVLIAPATETSTAVDLLFDYLRLNNNLRENFENLILAIGGVTVEWLSISRAIKNIQAQILWIHDQDDDVTPLRDVQPLIEKDFPNIRFMITKGWGHRRIYHEEKVMNAITAFL